MVVRDGIEGGQAGSGEGRGIVQAWCCCFCGLVDGSEVVGVVA